jgi:hypothetical protein
MNMNSQIKIYGGSHIISLEWAIGNQTFYKLFKKVQPYINYLRRFNPIHVLVVKGDPSRTKSQHIGSPFRQNLFYIYIF